MPLRFGQRAVLPELCLLRGSSRLLARQNIIAFVTAAAIGGVAGSPSPPRLAPDSIRCTSISGEVAIRTIS